MSSVAASSSATLRSIFTRLAARAGQHGAYEVLPVRHLVREREPPVPLDAGLHRVQPRAVGRGLPKRTLRRRQPDRDRAAAQSGSAARRGGWDWVVVTQEVRMPAQCPAGGCSVSVVME